MGRKIRRSGIGGKGRKGKLRGRRMIQRLRTAKGGMQGAEEEAGDAEWEEKWGWEREEEESGGVWGVASAINKEVSEHRGCVPNCTWWEEVASKRLCGDSVFYSKTWRLSMELTWKKQRRRVFWVEGTVCVKYRGERALGELKRSLVSMCGSEGGKWSGEREREWEKKRKDEELRMEHWVFKVGSSQDCTPCSVSLWWVWKLRKIVPPQCFISTNNLSGFLLSWIVVWPSLGNALSKRPLQMVGVQLGFQADVSSDLGQDIPFALAGR